VLVEIPAEGRVKYEVDPESGRLFVDRFLQTPMRYPANYGSIPGTRAGDGDPLDALVYTREPLAPGVLIRVRPLGLLRMTDAGEEDAKLIAVPVEAVDPSLVGISRLEDLPPLERERILMFFREYKRLPGGAQVDVAGFEDAAAARGVLEEARRRYENERGRSR
jgi:inorganic pyrophosphatase